MVNSNDNCWDDDSANYGSSLVLSENGLVATNTQDFLFYECNNVRAKTPFTLIPGAEDRRTFYFEVLVKNMTSFICVGLSGADFQLVPPPGPYIPGNDTSSLVNYWKVHSKQDAAGQGGFAEGDVIGCGLVQFPWDMQRQLFFTKNGKTCHQTLLPRDQQLLFPTVTLFGPGTAVEANFGDDWVRKPFRYNIAEH